MNTILVTGATGNVGRHVVHALLDRGATVRALVRDVDRARELLGPAIELELGDFTDPTSLRRAMRDASAVFLTSADSPAKVQHEGAVIDAASAAAVERIVKLSSPKADLGSDVAFWDWHAQIERHLRGSGVPWTIMRTDFLMSNLLAAAESVAAAGSLVAPAASARIAIVDPIDVGAVAAALLTSPGDAGKIYQVTGGTAVTYDDVAATLSSVLGRPVAFIDVPDEAARSAMLASGMPDWLVDALVTQFGKLRAGACAEVTSTVRDLTGREPRALADWVRDHARAFTPPATVPSH